MGKTLIERRDAAIALVSKLNAQINAEAILNNVSVGNVVEFSFGRAEKRRTLTGTVVGVRDDEKLGKLAAIQSGDGFDAQTYKVRVADISRNLSVEEDVSVEADPLSEA